MISYVYRVTSKTPINGMIYYVGKRTGELDDLQTGRYKTSSKLLRDIFNPNDFFIKIVKVFRTPEEAIKFEIKYHKRLKGFLWCYKWKDIPYPGFSKTYKKGRI